METFNIAKGIVLQLARKGHIAYFAGGWVRDFLMQHPSEDIDIATSASPAEILDLFPDTILVGLNFGVVIIVNGSHQFEVATFRKDEGVKDGRRPETISQATPEEDASRRDFTINGMFYDLVENKILDYVGGREDLNHKIVRAIGDPQIRFFEDRLRMLRAFRFASRFGFTIDLETQDAIRENASYLFPAVAPERVWQEFNKMAAYPRFDQALVEMHRLTLLDEIFPELKGMHIKELRQKVDSYAHFPPSCPTIVYLAELLEEKPIREKIQIAKRIRATSKDIQLLEYLDRLFSRFTKDFEGKTVDFLEWVHLFAHPNYPLGLSIMAARQPALKRGDFLKRYAALFKKLEIHVQRVVQNRPLISSSHLLQRGVLPGKEMGDLLRLAEKIAVCEDCSDPCVVLDKLFGKENHAASFPDS